MHDLWKNLNRLTEESLVGLSLADRADERDIKVRIYCNATKESFGVKKIILALFIFNRREEK